jgi:serine/threonine protein kinase
MRSRKQRAGAFIFSGTYGCAFGNPPLKCADEPSRRGNEMISKAMKRDTAINELRDGDKFKAIDAEKQYFLWPDMMCDVDATDFRPEDKIDKCPNLTTSDVNNKYTKLLLSLNGGQNLGKIVVKFDDWIAFFESLVNLFDGLELAHSNNLVHCDIKPYNIVSLRNVDGTFHTRYIDFGLSLKTTSVSPSSLQLFRNHKYYIWPAYITFFSFYSGTVFSDRDYDDVMTNFYFGVQRVKNTIAQPSYYTSDGSEKFGGNSLKTVIQTLQLSSIPLALKKLDIFSLGITLAEVYSRFIPHIVKTTSTGEYYAELPIKLNLVASTKFDTAIQWHLDVQNQISIPLAKLIYKMIHIQPSRSPTIVEAKTEFEAILPAIRTLFKKEFLFNSLKATGILGELPNPPTPTPLSPTNLSKIQVTPNMPGNN